MMGGDVEKVAEEDASMLEEEEEEGTEGCARRREVTLLYPAPAQARCLAARKVLLSNCAIDSVRWSGGAVEA